MDAERRLQALRRIAWTAVLLMLVVTTASAWLRLAQPRPGCDDWPICRAPPAPAAATPAVVGAELDYTLEPVRAAHRLTATLALLAVLALTVLSLRRRPRDRRVTGLSVALLSLALALSALGVFTPGSRASGVLLGNMLGGLLMLGLAWRLTRETDGPGVGDGGHRLTGWALAGTLLWGLQSALGVVAGGGGAFTASLVHPSTGVLAGLCALALAQAAGRVGLRAEAAALAVVAVLQWLLGGVAAMAGASAATVLLHNVGGAVGLALSIGLVGRGRAGG